MAMNSLMLGQIQQELSFDSVLSPYIYVFYASFIVTFIFTPIMRTVATHYGIIDQPDSIRKMHQQPVAYLGGVAVFLGWITGLALSQFLALHRQDPGLLPHVHVKFSIVLGACVIVVLGLWDDVQHINPWMKIAGQVFAAGLMLFEGVGTHLTSGILITFCTRVQLFLGQAQSPEVVPEWLIIATSSMMVIALVVFCCNATNLMDGLDGLCGGVTAIIAAGLLYLSVHIATKGFGLNANLEGLRVVLGLALLGAVMGFVPYNFNPASIFMGDTGSMFLGYSCAVLMILMGEQQLRWFLAGLIMFALPVLDTALAFARRYVNGRPLFSADKFHFHHQLVARGFSVKKTVLISYSLAIGFVLLGAFIVVMRTRYAGAFYLVIFGCIIVTAYKMGMVHEKPRAVPRSTLNESDSIQPITEATQASDVLEITTPGKVSGNLSSPVSNSPSISHGG